MSRTTTLLGATGAAILLGTLLSGCSASFEIGEIDTPGETGSSQGSDTDVFLLTIGDCFNDDDGGTEVTSIPIVDCAEPHDNEVYYSHLFDYEEYPGDDVIRQAGQDECVRAFGAFVGVAWEESTLDAFPITPTEESWSAGDRELLCAIYDTAGPVVGTLANANR